MALPEAEVLIGVFFTGTITGVHSPRYHLAFSTADGWPRGGGETVYAADLKSAGVVPRVGSNPTRPILFGEP